jgi:NAD(P)-dependent dehydrogenase (short-subunit alcohol dehydrogenase family)
MNVGNTIRVKQASLRYSMTVYTLIVGLLGLLTVAAAWSPQQFPSAPTNTHEHSVVSRKGFFQQAAGAALVSTAVVSGIGVEGAQAASANANVNNVYEPPRGSQNGRVIIITGASTGLGLESAKRLAAAGATTILTARTNQKGTQAVSEVQQYLKERSIENSNVYSVTLNLDDFESVKSFPQRYQQIVPVKQIDVLMNNAGVAAIPTREVTKDGFERTFQTNHLGHFYLTALLLPYLNQQQGASVINVSSTAHSFSMISETGKMGLDMNNLNSEIDYQAQGWASYGRSKLENILFTQELQRRADAAGMRWLTTASLHPGVVGTDIWRTSLVGNKSGDGSVVSSLQALSSKLFYKSVLSTEEGANTQVWLASLTNNDGDSNHIKGKYFDEHRKAGKLGEFAEDREKARLLWEKSEELTGVRFKFE